MVVCERPQEDRKSFLPITQDEFNSLLERIFGTTPRNVSWASAVSGGPDSLALTLLLHQWVLSHGGSLTALTVDHSLRDESAEEAHQVGVWLRHYGVAHVTLTSSPWKPQSRLQEKARTLRHYLLENYCLAHHIDCLFFGHHLQDQWETFLHRLSHKSGLDGLVCMRPYSQTFFGSKCRPLLDIPKDRLIDTLSLFKQPFLEDPSNLNPQFFRTCLRKKRHDLETLGLTPEAIGGTIHKLRDVHKSLEEMTWQAFNDTATVSSLGYATVNLKKLLSYPKEIARRLFVSLCLRIAPHPYPPKSQAFDELLRLLYPKDCSVSFLTSLPHETLLTNEKMFSLPHSYTVQSTLFLQKKITLWIMKAPCRKYRSPEISRFPRVPIDSVDSALQENLPSLYLWDKRFVLEKKPSPTPHDLSRCPYVLSPLGKDGLLFLKKHDHPLEPIPSPIYEMLPALWRNEELLAVPNLDFGVPEWESSPYGSRMPQFIHKREANPLQP